MQERCPSNGPTTARRAVAEQSGIVDPNTACTGSRGRPRPSTAGSAYCRPTSHHGKKSAPRPQACVVAHVGRFEQERALDNLDVVQLRRSMLIRSHGQGTDSGQYASRPYETTAMGRRVRSARTTRDPEVRKHGSRRRAPNPATTI